MVKKTHQFESTGSDYTTFICSFIAIEWNDTQLAKESNRRRLWPTIDLIVSVCRPRWRRWNKIKLGLDSRHVNEMSESSSVSVYRGWGGSTDGWTRRTEGRMLSTKTTRGAKRRLFIIASIYCIVWQIMDNGDHPLCLKSISPPFTYSRSAPATRPRTGDMTPWLMTPRFPNSICRELSKDKRKIIRIIYGQFSNSKSGGCCWWVTRPLLRGTISNL